VAATQQIVVPILEEQGRSTKIVLLHLEVALTAIKPRARDILSMKMWRETAAFHLAAFIVLGNADCRA
jgi:hypothetical protein